MSFRTKLVGILLATAFVVGTPLNAHAQGGFWEWIHKMSGPAFPTTVGGRIGICLNKPPPGGGRCGEFALRTAPEAPESTHRGFVPRLGAGSVSPQGFSLLRDGGGPRVGFPSVSDVGDATLQTDQDTGYAQPRIEWLAGVGVQYGWSGDNDDRGIEDVRMLLLEPHLRLLIAGAPHGRWVAGAGLGFHRFWHGTVPEPFWSTALILVAGYRFEFLPDGEGLPRWFLEAGIRGRYFFDRPESLAFGGLPEPDADDGELVVGGYFGVGYRFRFGVGG